MYPQNAGGIWGIVLSHFSDRVRNCYSTFFLSFRMNLQLLQCVLLMEKSVLLRHTSYV